MDPAELDHLREASETYSNKRRTGKSKRLETAYFDTTGLTLRRAGWALRVRKDGENFVQTLKSEDVLPAGALQRAEWSVPLDSSSPAPEILPGPAAKRALKGINGSSLRHYFTTQIDRHTYVLNADGDGRTGLEIEVALDRGVIKSGRQKTEICELELELLQGAPAELYDCALKLHERAPLRLETLSKSARGFALSAGEKPDWSKGRARALSRKMTVEAALEAVFRSCVEHWLANQAAVLDGTDPEGVHQMRVGLRRLRSALSVFHGAIPEGQKTWLREEARWALNSLGPARNWDVFLTEMLPPLQSAFPNDQRLEALGQAASAAQARGYDQSRQMIEDPRYTAFVLRLGGWLEGQRWQEEAKANSQALLGREVGALAEKLLSKRHKRVLKLGRNFAELSLEQRHDVRLAAKKLRYATEFFASLYPDKKTRPYLKAMKSLQDTLGHLNDIATLETLVAEVTTHPGRKPKDLSAGCGFVLGWYGHRLEGFESDLIARWDRFTQTKVFW